MAHNSHTKKDTGILSVVMAALKRSLLMEKMCTEDWRLRRILEEFPSRELDYPSELCDVPHMDQAR